MFNYIWPLVLIVGSNIIYQLCAKSIPSQMNTYASMTITYAVATVFSTVMFFVTSKGESFFRNLALTNWATIVLGIVITGLEVGFIFAYKASWKISTLSVVANAFLAVALIFAGLFVYREPINWTKIVGILICLTGLWFLNR